MTDPLQEFFIESLENLEQYDAGLLVLEKNPDSPKVISSIFRTLHTIKGTCGFLALHKLEAIAHAGENLLALVRDGSIPFTRSIASALLATGDAIRSIISELENTQKEGDGDYSALIERLVQLQKPEASPSQHLPAPSAAGPETDQSVAEAELPIESKALEGTIRVHVETLDTLMNLVGELVLTRNQITQFSVAQNSAPLQSAAQRLSQLTSELQDRMMKTRVQPIDTLWSKIPRTLRDLAELCHKKVRLRTEGGETELDRTVLDAIKDPLTHLLRNSVDHGIETPEVRIAAGKPPEGTISLRAFHAAGLVTIEIVDDGGGINLDRVKARALERRLITQDIADQMSERDLINLIFLPGFSTADKVSLVSGRGVGMDVVKTQIEKIGGIVEMTSTFGKGTTCRIKIPLTLAIIPVVIIGCCGERFAIPQSNLLEVIRIDQNLVIEHVRDVPVARLRGNLLPVVHLKDTLKLAPVSPPTLQHLAILNVGARQFGLVVDSIHEAEEVVVKPIGRALISLACFAGSTILRDGRISLILDVFGIGSQANLLQSNTQSAANVKPVDASAEKSTDHSDLKELLVFQVGGTRAAVPLEFVHRLEEFPRQDIEHCAGKCVIQYGHEILPLIFLAKVMGLPETMADASIFQTIIYHHNGHPLGLVIEAVEMIVKEKLETRTTGKRTGVMGSAVIGKRVTELVDVEEIIRIYAPEFSEVYA
jgi:two-component system chemotaxis sensor kinase CheA